MFSEELELSLLPTLFFRSILLDVKDPYLEKFKSKSAFRVEEFFKLPLRLPEWVLPTSSSLPRRVLFLNTFSLDTRLDSLCACFLSDEPRVEGECSFWSSDDDW